MPGKATSLPNFDEFNANCSALFVNDDPTIHIESARFINNIHHNYNAHMKLEKRIELPVFQSYSFCWSQTAPLPNHNLHLKCSQLSSAVMFKDIGAVYPSVNFLYRYA